MSGIKLVYFDIRGRGEPSRLVLAAAGQQWDDVRIPRDQWSSSSEKANSPYGQVPYLVYKGKTYGQSNAIANFLAREFGLYGKSNLEALRIDEVEGLVGDLIQTMVKARFEQDEAKKAELEKKLATEDLPKFLGLFEKLLKDNGSKGFFVGNSVTLADLDVFNITDTLLKVNADILASCPELQKLRSKVADHPKVKTYLASRKDSDF
ncbi:glutathione S-transferase-like [Littorina saxatilis]|uniref:Uncharacterized protein n=1 Tax=Littorina saxatilis TaxID=31220 RepID=A0AAN9BA09_9CAEN